MQGSNDIVQRLKTKAENDLELSNLKDFKWCRNQSMVPNHKGAVHFYFTHNLNGKTDLDHVPVAYVYEAF